MDTPLGLLKGDCLALLATFPDNSIDSIVTDPPYGLEFMGKDWDSPWKHQGDVVSDPASVGGFQDSGGGNAFSRSRIRYGREGTAMVEFQAWFTEIAEECLRVLKPGGHMLAFGGSRTYHRLACAIEDAGFEIRDSIMWVYGSGFPKSKNVALAIDKGEGLPNRGRAIPTASTYQANDAKQENKLTSNKVPEYEARTDKAAGWEGWGTALKPAHEIVVVARTPIEGTVAANVLKWGTGAINIDGCRVGTEGGTARDGLATEPNEAGWQNMKGHGITELNKGRWPANFIHDGSDEVLALFPTSKSTLDKNPIQRTDSHSWFVGDKVERVQRGDQGSAARFFYCAKASKAERNAGLDGLPKRHASEVTGRKEGSAGAKNGGYAGMTETPRANTHPTVKALDLMKYLCRLVTPPKGIILDPFLGSGTTAVAAILEGFNWVGCEMTPEYWPIIDARVKWAEREVSKTPPSLFQAETLAQPSLDEEPEPVQIALFE